MANFSNEAQRWQRSIIDRLRAEEDGNDHHDQQDAEEKTTNHAAAACGFKVEHVAAHDDSHRDTAHHGDADVVEGRDPPIRQGSRNIVLGELEGCADIRWRVEVGIYRNNQQSTRLNSSHVSISYAVFCLKKKR